MRCVPGPAAGLFEAPAAAGLDVDGVTGAGAGCPTLCTTGSADAPVVRVYSHAKRFPTRVGFNDNGLGGDFDDFPTVDAFSHANWPGIAIIRLARREHRNPTLTERHCSEQYWFWANRFWRLHRRENRNVISVEAERIVRWNFGPVRITCSGCGHGRRQSGK